MKSLKDLRAPINHEELKEHSKKVDETNKEKEEKRQKELSERIHGLA